MLGGMKGNTILSNLLSNYYLFMAKLSKNLLERSRNISKVINLIKESSSDIVCINEVIYPIQKGPMINYLKKLGYKSIVVDILPDNNKNINLCTILASKYKAKEIKLEITKDKKYFRQGNACVLYHPQKNLVVIGVHLALLKKFRKIQLHEITKFVEIQRELNRDVIVMGDFNERIYNLQKNKDFKGLELLTNKIPTFPTFPIFNKSLKWLKRDYDHIFYSKENSILSSQIKGGDSDHFMLTFEVIPKKEVIIAK